MLRTEHTNLFSSAPHISSTLLRARILLDKECPDDGIHFSKLAAKLSCTADEKVKAMDLLDRAMAAHIVPRRRADELERAAAAERERTAEQQCRAQETLDEFEQTMHHEVIVLNQKCAPCASLSSLIDFIVLGKDLWVQSNGAKSRNSGHIFPGNVSAPFPAQYSKCRNICANADSALLRIILTGRLAARCFPSETTLASS